MAAKVNTYLLRCMTNEGLGVQYVIQLPQNRGKIGVSLDSGQQVVITTLLLHHSCCLLGQNANLLVAVLEKAETSIFKHKSKLPKTNSFMLQTLRKHNTCLFSPAFTMAIMMFSVAIKGSSWRMCLSMTLG